MIIADHPLFEAGDVVTLKSNKEIMQAISEYFNHDPGEDYTHTFLDKQGKEYEVTDVTKCFGEPCAYELSFAKSLDFSYYKKLQDFFKLKQIYHSNDSISCLFGDKTYESNI